MMTMTGAIYIPMTVGITAAKKLGHLTVDEDLLNGLVVIGFHFIGTCIAVLVAVFSIWLISKAWRNFRG